MTRRFLLLKALPLFLFFPFAATLNSQTLSATGSRIAADMSALRPASAWKTGIVATVFWCGEQPTKKNPTPNTASSWDRAWMSSFGGFDDPNPEKRAADFRPASFVPQQNPFYVALPYNDCVNYQTTKAEAAKIVPWYKSAFTQQGKSVCRDRWLAIRYGERTCYAQWSDCGPFVTTDASYVFGSARPINAKNNGAGIDLAPAVRDYLGFVSGRKCDWRFVDLADVPDGPWKVYGTNNHFARNGGNQRTASIAMAAAPTHPAESITSPVSGDARLEELRRERDKWFASNTRSNSGGWSR